MLQHRQKLTIKHLRSHQKLDNLGIIQYCLKELDKPHWSDDFMSAKRDGRRRLRGSLVRKRSTKYYQEIINYFAQGGE